MRRGTLFLLLIIVLMAVGAAFVDFWPNSTTGKTWHGINNPYSIKLGLDLQGGVSVLLVPDPAKHYTKAEVDSAISSTVQQITKRVNGGLGVNEPNIRTLTDSKGNQSIALELPGLNSGNQDQQIRTILRPGNLEFWDTGQTPLAPGATLDPTQFAQYNPGGKPQFTGKDLDPNQISVGTDQQTGAVVINFEMQGGAIAQFGAFTGKHIGDQLTITLDRKVISSASINSQINGPGIITGQFTQAEAQSIVTVLQYGALPLSLQIASEETVGATLGTDSIIKSVIAGIIGLSIVVLFMILYYRPLAGIAGFILSIGMAVDANVLIFERIKEELRSGRMLSSAIDIGWKRAWPSIRDSNISTLITCAVLFYFGSNFGASIIVGFATNLFLGVLVSMFTAIVVTRTFLNVLVPTGVINHPALFGLPAGSIASASLARRNSTV
ncbi:MAG: preprotein translocase subunit SecD [Chloroflexi bacterium]|nr:MAG: preprotein translocase subunit SecD [Chloroflexota bacterium]